MLGLLSWLVTTPRRAAQSTVFAALIAVLAAGHFYVISALSEFWIDAYARELEIVGDVEQHLGAPEPKTTLMLAGICSYNGPAVVFEADWDLSGALRLHYGDRTLSADVLRPGAYEVTRSGIATILYEGEDDYDFGSWLIMYDYRHKTTHALTDRETVLDLFKATNLDAHCPPGGEGVGVRVF